MDFENAKNIIRIIDEAISCKDASIEYLRRENIKLENQVTALEAKLEELEKKIKESEDDF